MTQMKPFRHLMRMRMFDKTKIMFGSNPMFSLGNIVDTLHNARKLYEINAKIFDEHMDEVRAFQEFIDDESPSIK